MRDETKFQRGRARVRKVVLGLRLLGLLLVLIALGFLGDAALVAWVTHDPTEGRVVALTEEGDFSVAYQGPAGQTREARVPFWSDGYPDRRVTLYRDRDDPGRVRLLLLGPLSQTLTQLLVGALGCFGLAFLFARSLKRLRADLEREERMMDHASAQARAALAQSEASGSPPPSSQSSSSPLAPPDRGQDLVAAASDRRLAGLSAAFLWAVACLFVLAFTGVFHGRPETPWTLAGLALVSLAALAGGTLARRTLLSNRHGQVCREWRCLGLRRRRYQPIAGFTEVRVEQTIARRSGDFLGRAPSSIRSKPRGPTLSVRSRILLRGPEVLELARDTPTQALRRAKQIADYLGLPLRQP